MKNTFKVVAFVAAIALMGISYTVFANEEPAAPVAAEETTTAPAEETATAPAEENAAEMPSDSDDTTYVEEEAPSDEATGTETPAPSEEMPSDVEE